MGSAATARWKNNEKAVERLLVDWGIEAKRKTRGANFAVSDFDIDVLGEDWLKMDAKYSVKGFRTNRILDETTAKYAKEKGDFALLFCKGYKENGQKVVMEDQLFAGLLAVFLKKMTPEEVKARWQGLK